MRHGWIVAGFALLMGCGGSSTTVDMGSGGNPDLASPSLLDMTAAGGPAATVMVGSGGLKFVPSTVTVKVGDTVQWTWAASGHSVTSGMNGTPDGKFCSPDDKSCMAGNTSASGTVYSHTFTTAGTFPYYCAPHFAAGMTGTVTVQ